MTSSALKQVLNFIVANFLRGLGLFFTILGIYIAVSMLNLFIVRNAYCKSDCDVFVTLDEKFSLIRNQIAYVKDTELRIRVNEFVLIDRPDKYEPIISFEISNETGTFKRFTLDTYTVSSGGRLYDIEPMDTDWETFITFKVTKTDHKR